MKRIQARSILAINCFGDKPIVTWSWEHNNCNLMRPSHGKKLSAGIDGDLCNFKLHCRCVEDLASVSRTRFACCSQSHLVRFPDRLTELGVSNCAHPDLVSCGDNEVGILEGNLGTTIGGKVAGNFLLVRI